MENHPIIFKRVKKGDQPSAGEHNKIIDALSPAPPNKSEKHYAKLRLLQLGQVMGNFNNTPGLDRDRSGNRMHFNESSSEFEENSNSPVTNISDPFNLVYDDNEVLVGWYSEQSNQFYPLNPRTVRHAITCRDASNRYPSRSQNPDTYPIKFVRLNYPEAAGRQNYTLDYISAEVETDPPPAGEDRFVLNIVDPDLEDAYIPEGTVIQVYNVTDQWFTFYCCASEDSSVSVSDSSYSSSSKSSSDSSASSRSVSSASSRGSSLSSSSSGRSSSSSGGSSGSSSSSGGSSLSSGGSSVSSGGSSASSGGSSGSSSRGSSASSRGSSASSANSSASSSISEDSDYECIWLVSCVQFNPITCILTVYYRRLCFPLSLGILIGDPTLEDHCNE